MVTAANLESCSVGVQKGEACHKIISSRIQELKTRVKIKADIKLMGCRTEISNLKTICLQHVKKYLTRFESIQKARCNSFSTHKKAFTSK